MEFHEISREVLADMARCIGAVDQAPVRRLVGLLAERRRVTLIGTGRSGAMLRAMAVRLGHLGIEAAFGEATPGGLVLVGSGSGATPVPLEQVRAARKLGVTLAAITAAPGSPIAQAADLVIHIPAPVRPDADTPHTLRSLFEECLLLVCDLACRMLQDRLALSPEAMQARHSPSE